MKVFILHTYHILKKEKIAAVTGSLLGVLRSDLEKRGEDFMRLPPPEGAFPSFLIVETEIDTGKIGKRQMKNGFVFAIPVPKGCTLGKFA